jgi:polar amino acid transport system permease protein
MAYDLNFNFIWLYSDRLLWGLLLSLALAVAGTAIGIAIGLSLALLFSVGGRFTRAAITCYVAVIRNVPLLLLLYLVFYGIPSAGGALLGATTSFILTLGIYAGAYLVEVFRAGIEAIPRALVDAGKAIGLRPWQRRFAIELPTMLRFVLPSLSNALLLVFKDTSLASAIAIPELMYQANWINTNTFRVLEVYAVVTPIYLLTGYAILHGLRRLERQFAIGARR